MYKKRDACHAVSIIMIRNRSLAEHSFFVVKSSLIGININSQIGQSYLNNAW